MDSHSNIDLTPKPLDPDRVGADAAMLRAARKAQRRALETTGSFPVWRDGKIVYRTELPELGDENAEPASE